MEVQTGIPESDINSYRNILNRHVSGVGGGRNCLAIENKAQEVWQSIRGRPNIYKHPVETVLSGLNEVAGCTG